MINQRVNRGGSATTGAFAGSQTESALRWSASACGDWPYAGGRAKRILLDEPLSNLDAALRVQMRIEISRLHKRTGRTMIYVTHDQVEAMTLADKIVVLDAGRVAQVGETAGAVPLSGRPFCRRIYRFAKDELPAGKSDRHCNRSSAGGAADAKSSASLAAG